MKPASRRWTRICAFLVACLQLAALGQEPKGPPVEKIVIRHRGPAAVSEDLVRAHIRVRVGEPYTAASIDEDVRNLYATGYFRNVQVGAESSDKGVTLVYEVQGKSVITEIRFSGNKKYSNSKLRKKVTSKVGEPEDDRKLFNDAQEILKMYQKAGLQRTEVKPVPSINEELGRAVVTFEITEAPKVRITDVVFDGAKEFKQRKLRRVIKTRRWWMWSWITGSGKLKDDVFEEDKEKLRNFYAERGYIDFELKDVRFEQPSPTRMSLHLQVDEGSLYKVGNVEFAGNELFTKAEITGNLRSREGDRIKYGLLLKDGQTFTPKKLQRDVEAITDFYGARGYIEARVDPQKVANVERGTLDLKYSIREGDRYEVEKIEIRGNTKTKDKVIRRELAISPGETFDTVRVKVSKSRLEQLQFFEKVDTTNEDTRIENRKNLVIGVEEKNTGNIGIGAGFSSVDSVVGFVEVSQGNFDLFNAPKFTGGGQKARLRIQAGPQRQDYLATFIEPWFLGRRLSLSVDLYHRQLNFLSDNYEQRQTGMRLGLTRQLPRNFVGGISYTIENVGINFNDAYKTAYKNTVLLQEEGSRLVSKVGATLAYDTRNNLQVPTKGMRFELLPEVAGGPFAGDADYYRLEARATQYWNPGRLFSETSYWQDFFAGHALELSGRIGVIQAYADGDRGKRNRVPLFDRWYLGGLYSLRGARFREVGPRDVLSNEPIGGGTYWLGGAEYSIPVIERIRLAAFYDIGMVYEDAYSFDPQSFIDANGRLQTTHLYNDNWGVGIRLNLPIGPLRIDYAIPMTHDTRSSGAGRVQFGVGWSRDF
ncbi:MAG: outer membrane protein assembly factor BamA [Verrucomicrobia bacterium]|nr:MAG: outer membrane protein assembly factor BamA [Verrucomicrobiota bacterium]